MPESKDPERALLRQLGDSYIEKAVRSCVARLQRMSPQSGEDTPLRHVWDEVCAQVQGEESVFWGSYLDLIEQTVQHVLSSWPELHLHAMWLRTDAGFDWLFDHDDDPDASKPNDPRTWPVRKEAIVAEIEQQILNAAANVSSERIDLFNAREYD